MSDSKPKTYRGNCHCAAFVYELRIPEIKMTFSCNCSFCSKKGILWNSIEGPNTEFKVVKGDEADLAVYRFGKQVLSHKFCKTCGSALLARWPSSPPGRPLIVNARCLQNFDIWTVPSQEIPGAAMGELYSAPEFDGLEPEAVMQGSKTYHGGCHCGRVKIAYKGEPLDETSKVTECNCSICQRNGYLFVYPRRDQVVITGRDSLTTYAHSLKVFLKTFCSRCGVQVQNSARPLSAGELAGCPDGFAAFYEGARPLEPVNLRLINGLDLAALKPERTRDWDLIEPKYVNP